jgi:hypothetical protein
MRIASNNSNCSLSLYLTFKAEVFKIVNPRSINKLNILPSGTAIGVTEVTLQCDVVVLQRAACEAMLQTAFISITV